MKDTEYESQNTEETAYDPHWAMLDVLDRMEDDLHRVRKWVCFWSVLEIIIIIILIFRYIFRP